MDKRSKYFLGVAVGLIIAWATSALAYYIHGNASLPTLIIFELVVSIVMIVIALLINTEKRHPPRTKARDFLFVLKRASAEEFDESS